MPRTTRSILVGATLAAVATMTASGCSSDGGTGSSGASAPASVSASSAPTSAPAARTLTAAELEKAALTSKNVPAGFKVTKPAASDVLFGPADTAQPAACQPIPDIGAPDAAVKPSATADRTYHQTAKPAVMLFGRVESYPAGDAEKAMANLRAVLKSCVSYKSKSPDDGSVTPVKITVGQAPSLGDEAVMLDATGDTGGKALTVRMVEIRVGSSMALFAGLDMRGSGAFEMPEQLMSKQVEELRAASAG